MQEPKEIACDDVNAAIDSWTRENGYRLDMIVPADSPDTALLSHNGEQILLRCDAGPRLSGQSGDADVVPKGRIRSEKWITGRAGMQYRNLIPGRLGGRLIASHIRLAKGGEVPDYVHYHKVRFQMIFCVRGAIRVVYEDQGEPFWLRPGDCVLQPPEIRHRVLWAEAGSEVVEVGMPAVHETWVEHEIKLPTAQVNPDRIFNGQRFVRSIASKSVWSNAVDGGFEYADTGIASATQGVADVVVIRINSLGGLVKLILPPPEKSFSIFFVLRGNAEIDFNDGGFTEIFADDCFLADANANINFVGASEFEALVISI